MKGLLPNEFPFSRKRKPARRKASPAPATHDAPLSAPQVETSETAASAPVVAEAAAAAPVVVAEAQAPEVEQVAITRPPIIVKTIAHTANAVAATATVAPAAPAAPAIPATPAPAALATTASTMQVARHATSRASITPIATAAGLPRASAILPEPAAEPAAGYTGPERRRSPRQSLRAKATYRNDLNPAAAGPVQILNFSMCGMRFWSTRAMKIGERGNVKMEIGPVKWSSRVKVVTCTAQDGEGYAMGCEFAANEVARRSVA